MTDNDDAGSAVVSSSESFWEVDCFKRTVRRAEDGMNMCNELYKMLQDRSEIEKEYAKHLRDWAKKWHSAIEKGPEYGTHKDMLFGVLTEAEGLADVHTTVKDQLVNIIGQRVKDWRNENYKKSLVGGCKVVKNFDDDFKKAQKPWAKQLSKVQKAKKEYHTSCKLERQTTTQETLAHGASDLSAEQLLKIREKADKGRKDMEKAKENYEQSLKELNSLTPRYMEDMNVVFRSTQDLEEKRLKFFKKTLVDLQGLLDLSKNQTVANVYQQMRVNIEKSNPEKDLKWWADTQGVGMSMAWPTFEDYAPEVSQLTVGRGSKSMYVANNNHDALTGSYRSSAVVYDPPPAAVNDTKPAYSTISSQSVRNSTVPQVQAVVVPTAVPRQITRQEMGPPASTATSATVRPASSVGATVAVGSGYANVSNGVKGVNGAAGGGGVQGNVYSNVPQATVADTCSTNPFSTNPFGDDEDEEDVDSGSAATAVVPRRIAPVAGGGHEGRGAENTDGDAPPVYESIGQHQWSADPSQPIRRVPVCALFDYTGIEEDELSFKSGDTFVKLQDEDEQGWCTGEINGRVGLYPANYCRPTEPSE